ncbi:MAG: hypothetical protein AAGA08_17020 [Pseudomonadota bacterium]
MARPYESDTHYRLDWMTDDQWACTVLLARLFRGFHHMNSTRVKDMGQTGVAYNYYGELASFDFDGLTRLLLMGHEECIRVCIGPSGPGMIKIILHKRHKREGRLYERHPTIHDALEEFSPKQKELANNA